MLRRLRFRPNALAPLAAALWLAVAPVVSLGRPEVECGASVSARIARADCTPERFVPAELRLAERTLARAHAPRPLRDVLHTGPQAPLGAFGPRLLPGFVSTARSARAVPRPTLLARLVTSGKTDLPPPVV